MAKEKKASKTAKPVEATTEKASTSKDVVSYSVNSRALAVDVGPLVIEHLASARRDESKIHELQDSVNYHRGEAAGRLLVAMTNACKADPKALDPTSLFSDKQADKNAFLERMQIALGIREVNKEGALVYTEAVKKFMPPARRPKGYKESEKGRMAIALQSNVTKLIRETGQAVVSILENDVQVSFNEEAKVASVSNAPKLIAGPTGKADLTGATVEGAGQKASITAFRRMAEEKHKPNAGKNGRTTGVQATAQKALESEDAFGELSNAWIAAINGMEGTFTETQLKHIESVYAAAAGALGVD